MFNDCISLIIVDLSSFNTQNISDKLNTVGVKRIKRKNFIKNKKIISKMKIFILEI